MDDIEFHQFEKIQTSPALQLSSLDVDVRSLVSAMCTYRDSILKMVDTELASFLVEENAQTCPSNPPGSITRWIKFIFIVA